MNCSKIALGLALLMSGTRGFACIDMAGSWMCSESAGDPLISDLLAVEQDGTDSRSIVYRFANNSFPLDGLPHPHDTVMEVGISITTCEAGTLKIFTTSQHMQNSVIYSRYYDFKRTDDKLIVNNHLKLSEDGYVFRTFDYPEVVCTRSAKQTEM